MSIIPLFEIQKKSAQTLISYAATDQVSFSVVQGCLGVGWGLHFSISRFYILLSWFGLWIIHWASHGVSFPQYYVIWYWTMTLIPHSPNCCQHKCQCVKLTFIGNLGQQTLVCSETKLESRHPDWRSLAALPWSSHIVCSSPEAQLSLMWLNLSSPTSSPCILLHPQPWIPMHYAQQLSSLCVAVFLHCMPFGPHH